MHFETVAVTSLCALEPGQVAWNVSSQKFWRWNHCIAGARLLLQFASAQLREDFEAAAAPAAPAPFCSSTTTRRQVVDAAVKQNPEALRGFLSLCYEFWEMYGDVFIVLYLNYSECI